MSSFRRAETEASLRLYSLPRRELQALCKQYGIPANKTNVAMADALSACVPVENAITKASAGSNFLRVSKTTPMKMKLERTTRLPETSLASFVLNGKRKISPVKLAEKPTLADREELRFNTTPLKRGVKRSERQLIQTLHEENTKATVVPACTRAATLHDRFGKSAAAASSHKPQASTPRKLPVKAVETVSRTGGDALPPVSSGLLSTLKLSEPQVPESIPKHQPETKTEIVEISHTEIEFRNAALHEELFGVGRNVKVQEDQVVSQVAREAEDKEDVPESSAEVGFEFRDMALHKELFGSDPKNATNSQEYAHSPHDLQRPGASANAIDSVSSEHGIFNSPFTSSPDDQDCSVQDVRVLSSIREDASDDSDSRVEELEEHTRRILPQGRDLGPHLDDISSKSPACSLSRTRRETDSTFEQESTVMSPRRYVPVTNALTSIPNNADSPLVNAATPLTKIRNNIDSTLMKATSILEKLAALRADAEKKRREGYWEPKFSAVVENASPIAVSKTPFAKTAFVVDRDLPSAKKARLTPKAILGTEKGLIVCKDASTMSKGEIPSVKTIRIADESRDLSVVSDKENQSEKSMEDRNSRKLGGFGKEKKGKTIEVLKDRSKNLADHVTNEINEPGTIKVCIGEVHPEKMSLRKLRAQVKEKVRHLETSKASDLRSQRGAWNTSH